VIGSGEHSSLLQYGNNYCRKRFYSTSPGSGNKFETAVNGKFMAKQYRSGKVSKSWRFRDNASLM
jgi:hypothetical protein